MALLLTLERIRRLRNQVDGEGHSCFSGSHARTLFDRDGERLNVPENTEVELTVHDPHVLPAKATSAEGRERALRELFASWDAHPLRPDAPRLTRDEMHERR